MTVRVLTSVEDVEALVPEWQQLAERIGARATAQPLWCLAWWQHLQRGRLAVATAESAGSLVALAPLHEHRLAGIRFVRFLGHGLGAVTELLVAPGYEHAAGQVWEQVLRRRRCHLQLLEYRAPAAGVAELVASCPQAVVAPSDRCPVVSVAGTTDDYLASRPKGLRRTLRRVRQRLDAGRHIHDVERVSEPDGLARVLPEVMAIYDAAERDRPRLHLLAGRWAPFTIDLLHGAAAAGALQLFVGRVDGRPASFDVVFTSAGRFECWLGRYHPAFRPFAPGHLSLQAVVAHAFATGATEVDMGLGDDRYKRLWCDSRSYATLNISAGSSVVMRNAGCALVAAGATLRSRRRRTQERSDAASP